MQRTVAHFKNVSRGDGEDKAVIGLFGMGAIIAAVGLLRLSVRGQK
jgi:hypothetical protein